jgi:hypothetical protein
LKRMWSGPEERSAKMRRTALGKEKARPRREQCGEGGGRSAADADGSRLLRGITRASGRGEACDLAAAWSFRVRRGGARDGGKRGSGEYGPQRG